jgi:hypothetical protein
MEGRAQANATHRSLLPNLQGSGKKLNPVILFPHHVFKERNQRLNISCHATVFVFAFFKVLSFGGLWLSVCLM